MQVDPVKVLYDLASRSADEGATAQERMNAVGALAALDDSRAAQKLRALAGSSEVDEEIKVTALRALLAHHPEFLEDWLRETDEPDTAKWQRLADLHRHGVALDLSTVGRWKRFSLALRSRGAVNPDWRPDLITLGAIALTGVAVLLVALLPLGFAEVEIGRLLTILGLPLAFTFAHSLLLGFLTHPATTSPDRWWFGLPEIGVTVAVTLLLATVSTGLFSVPVDEILPAIFAFAGIAGLLRLVSLLFQNLSKDRRAAVVITSLSGIAGTYCILTLGATVSTEPRQFYLAACFSAAAPAAAFLFWRVDHAHSDSPPDTRTAFSNLMLVSLGALVVMTSIALMAVMVRAVNVELSTAVIMRGSGSQNEVFQLGKEVSVRSAFNQDLTLDIESADRLLLSADGTRIEPTVAGSEPGSLRFNLTIDANQAVGLSLQGGEEPAADKDTPPDNSLAPLSEAAVRLSLAVLGLYQEFGSAEENEDHEILQTWDFAPFVIKGSIGDRDLELVSSFSKLKESGFSPNDRTIGVALKDLSWSSAADDDQVGQEEKPRGSIRVGRGSILKLRPGTGSIAGLMGRFQGLPAEFPPESGVPGNIRWIGYAEIDEEIVRQSISTSRWMTKKTLGELTGARAIEAALDIGLETAKLVLLGEPIAEIGDLVITYRSVRDRGVGGLMKVVSQEDEKFVLAEPVRFWPKEGQRVEPCYQVPVSGVLSSRLLSEEAYHGVIDELGAAASLAEPRPAVAQEREPPSCNETLFRTPNELYMFNSKIGGLFRLDTDSGTAVKIVDISEQGSGDSTGLAYDSNNEHFFVSTPLRLHKYDLNGGLQQIGDVIGSVGSSPSARGAEGLAYDPVGKTLFGEWGNRVFLIDPETSVRIEDLPKSPVRSDTEALAFDHRNRRIFALSEDTLSAYDIDQENWRQIKKYVGERWRDPGLAFDPEGEVLFAIGNVGNSKALYRIDPNSGELQLDSEFDVNLGGGLALGALP